MRAALSALRTARRAALPLQPALRAQRRHATTKLAMPAMSPTMTEGGIAGWKVQEGASFAAGDVLLEVETDKATIDVEAQDDGVMGKILMASGSKNVPVGATIALLAEEGDDLSKIADEQGEAVEKTQEVPAGKPEEAKGAKEAKQPEKASPEETEKHEAPAEVNGHPLAPSVRGLLHDAHLSAEKLATIKPTGKHGMLTRGDVLAAMGKVDNPYGSAKKLITDPVGPSGRRASDPITFGAGAGAAAAPAKEKPLDGPALRRAIVQGLSKATAAPAPGASADAEFDDLLADYAPLLPAGATVPTSAATDDLAGLI